MSDQYSHDMRDQRELFIPQQNLPSFSYNAPAELEQGPEHASAILAIAEGKKFLTDRPYNPKAFRVWINIGMAKSRQAFKETEKSTGDRSDAMKVNRRIFECLDASTEKDLEKIKDKEAAMSLLERCDWDDTKSGVAAAAAAASAGEKGTAKKMKREKNRRKAQRNADEKGAKEAKLMNGMWRESEKERVDEANREAWRHQRDQDREVELDEDNLP